MPPNQDTDPALAGTGATEAEVIDLEPSAYYDPIADGSLDGIAPARGPAPAAIVEGHGEPSISGETTSLRRSRLGSASTFLAVVYGVLVVYVLATSDDIDHRLIWVMMAARFALAAAVAVVLARPVPLSNGQLRLAEYGLFGGLMMILVASQYVVTRDLLVAGEVPSAIAYMKNGVLQAFALIVLYGMFIPNHARATAAVALTMALAPVLSLALLMEHDHLGDVLHQLRSSEHAGSNVVFLMVGVAMAVYGSHVLNGLREELHHARKFGQYKLLRKIGSGGMGEVYLAEHQLLKRPCALKLIRPESVANPTALARFEREVRSASRLSHPNSIDIYDYGHSDDGTFYYVMEFLPGISLEELVDRAGPLPPGRAVYLLRQACAGLAEAHAIGLVHRDLKPSNIFVARRGGEDDVAKVLDFGLVKQTREPDAPALTADLTVSGTPSYMAPEQATANRDLDARADVYALGAVAYFALTGRPPFAGETPFAIMMAHARDQVTPPSEVRPGLPADLEAVVLKALEKDPDARYPDARAMGRALAACEAAHDWDADRADQWWAGAGATLRD